MIDVSQAAAQQLTFDDGSVSDWTVKVGDRLLYTLPKEISVEQTFEIRRAIETLMDEAFKAGNDQAEALCEVKINRIVENGNAQLNFLKQENERLAKVLEQQIGE